MNQPLPWEAGMSTLFKWKYFNISLNKISLWLRLHNNFRHKLLFL